MLELLRRKKGTWFIKVLLLGVAASFFIGFGILMSVQKSLKGKNSDIVAHVGDDAITKVEFDREYNNLIKRYQEIFKENTDELIKQLNLKQQILETLIARRLMVKEAKRMGLVITDEELRKTIEGYFPGEFTKEGYFRTLRANQLGPAEFEASERDRLLVEKFSNLIKDSIHATEEEMYNDYRMEKERINLEYVVIDPKNYEKEIKSSDEDLRKYYTDHRNEFYSPEKRKIDYLAFSPSDVRKEVKITETDLKKYYDSHRNIYKHPKQVKASHILIMADPKADKKAKESSRKLAESVLAMARSGQDFASLAKTFSQDPGSKDKGGDLGYFSKGQMVKAFEEAAFSMKVGEISPVIETPYGYHIIRLEDIREEGETPFEQAKDGVRPVVENEKAKNLAKDLGEKASEIAQKGHSLKDISQELNVPLKSTDWFEANGFIPGIADSKGVAEVAFAIKKGEKSSLIKGGIGSYLIELTAIDESKPQEFEQVKENVRGKLLNDKSASEALKQANEIIVKLQPKAENIKQVAKTGKLALEETGFFSMRGDQIPKIGNVAESSTENGNDIFKQLFQLSLDHPVLEHPFFYQKKYYVFKLKEKQAADSVQYEKEKSEWKKKFLERKQQEVFGNLLEELKKKAKITNYSAIEESAGGGI